jgi:hypothetical protein
MEKDFINLLTSYYEDGGSGRYLVQVFRDHFDVTDNQAYGRLCDLLEGLSYAHNDIMRTRDGL